MSSPAQGGPSAPKEKKGVSSRVLTRMKTIIKKAEKRMSISGPSRGSPALSQPPAAAAPVPAPPAEAAAAAGKGKAPAAEHPDADKIPRAQLYEERARRLGERFGLEIKPDEWHSTEGDALRVNRPIRMRIHRTCHRCNTDFGSAKAKECPKCQHVRCKKCARYPPKRTESEKQAARERRAALLKEQKENAPIVADWDLSTKPPPLTRPSKTGGQELIYKKPRQRLRRTCCQCSALFAAGHKQCDACQHTRCTDCPRDPAKKDKYPYGYPGDEFGVRSKPWYECHLCQAKYATEPGDAGGECPKCAHPRCQECRRMKPQRVEPEPDPEILKAIETKLSKLKVG